MTANKHHQIYIDNYFTSVPILEYFMVNGVDVCGTIRTNRKGLPVHLAEDLERGECDYRVLKQGLVLFKWEDNKAVHVLSNFHGTDMGYLS